MSKSQFNKNLFPKCNQYDFADKVNCIDNHIVYMLNRTQSMFEYDGLPDTIPQRMMELYLQVNGTCVFYEHKDDLYIFTGGLGGKPNVYYMPTIYTISNPALNLSKNLEIDKDCILVLNDSLWAGLMPMFTRYATAICENELSMNIASINSRVISLISAGDDRTVKSAEKYIQDIRDGKQSIIAENAFLEGVKSQPYGHSGNTNMLTNLIEYEQYLKASWYNEIGLNANYNMKRESLNSNESQLNDDMLLPLIDDMIACRREGIEKVNRKYGLNISVEFNSSWRNNNIEWATTIENMGGGDDSVADIESNDSEVVE